MIGVCTIISNCPVYTIFAQKILAGVLDSSLNWALNKYLILNVILITIKNFISLKNYWEVCKINYFAYFCYFSEIWNRFLEFESNIGDLQSIVKVEKRRSAVLEKIKEFQGKETAQLVDRYKFLDLYPCTPAELKSK